MKQHVFQFTVETDDELIVISQENGTHEDGSDSIILNPCQIDLLIKILQNAKEDFVDHSRVKPPCFPDSVMVHSK